MSHVASTACYRLVMPGVAKNVLLAMADMANDDLFCWPSIETICTRTCWSRRAVIAALAWLEDHDAIRADRSNGRKTTWWLTPEKFDASKVLLVPTNRCANSTGAPTAPVRQQHRTRARGALNQCANSTLSPLNPIEPFPLPPEGGVDVDNFGTEETRTPAAPPIATGQTADQHGRPPNAPATAPPVAVQGAFEVFIAPWPEARRRDLERVRKRFERLLQLDPSLATTLCAAAAWQAREQGWARDGGAFAKLPLQWLRGRRWQDTPDAEQRMRQVQAEQDATQAAVARVMQGSSVQTPAPSPTAPDPATVRARLADLRAMLATPPPMRHQAKEAAPCS